MRSPLNQKPNAGEKQSQPAINLPPILTLFIGAMLGVHLVVTYVVTPETMQYIWLRFGYIPQRENFVDGSYVTWLENFYSLFSHAFLHGSWPHLIFNAAWLAVFGTPIVHRYGNWGFILVFLFGSAVGALTFEFITTDEFTILIGASGAVSALMGGALRFMFQPVVTYTDPETQEMRLLGRKLASLPDLLRNRRTFNFAVIWLGVNLLFGIAPQLIGVVGAVAWQAHIGGFVAGFIIVAWLEKRWI